MSEEWDRSVSWSKMLTYDICPRQFKFQYVDDIEEEEYVRAREEGIDIHEYFDEFHQLHEGSDGPNKDTAITLAQEMFSPEQQARYRPWIQKFFQWQGWMYDRWGQDFWNPVFTEKWVEVQIDGKVHHGYVDAIYWDPDDESYGVVDYKPEAKDNSNYKGQIAYYGDFLLEVSDLLDQDVEWGGVYGYKSGEFKRWDIHWASSKATNRKIEALVELQDGYDPDFGFMCQYCDYTDECMKQEAEEGGNLLET